jgi:HEAT repeat protein
MPSEFYACLSPDGMPLEVEIGAEEIVLHFADKTERLSLDASTGDLNVVRFYLGEAIRSGPSPATERAIILLGGLASPWTTLLVKALGSPERSIRQCAASALANSQDNPSQRAVIDALSDAALNDADQMTRSNAKNALAAFAGADLMGSPQLGARRGFTRRRIAQVLVDAEAKEAGRQEQAILGDPTGANDSWGSGSLIGEVRDVAALYPMIEVLNGIRPGRHETAARALGYLRDARAVPALISTLRRGALHVRPEAAWALGEICDPRAIVPLSAASIKGALDLRIAATAAMAEFAREYQDPGCLDPLIRRLKDVPEVRREAAWGLKFLRDPRSFDALREALFLPDVECEIIDFTQKPSTAQEAVAAALAELDDERAADDFIRLLNVEGSSGKFVAMLALAHLRDPRVLTYWNPWWQRGWGLEGAESRAVEEALREMGAREVNGTWVLQ